jgi:excisionase family DNA binding protein
MGKSLMDLPENRLYTVGELAEYFRVDPESIRRWLRDGRLIGINLGRRSGWRIRQADLEAFVEARRTRPGETPPEVLDDDSEGV